MKSLSFFFRILVLTILLLLYSCGFAQNINQQKELVDNNCDPSWINIAGLIENIVTFHISIPSSSGWDPLWLQYDYGINDTALGFSEEFTFASKWSSDQLQGFEDKYITRVKFFPTEEGSIFTLNIWNGEDGNNLIFSQNIESVIINEWNEIELLNPVEIIPDDGIWIGFEVQSTANAAGAGLFSGSPNSNLFKINDSEWQQLSDLNLDFSWNLGVYVEDEEINDSIYEFLGYNMYKDGLLLNNELITQSYYPDTLYDAGNYYYYSTAIYDVCGEIDPGNIIYIDWGGYVGTQKIENHFKISPNPANGHIKIESNLRIQTIRVLNSIGQEMKLFNQVNLKQYIINTLNLDSGVYFIEIQTNQGIQKSKIIIQH